MNCPDNCENNEFFCSAQQRCIPEVWKCDGKVDCLEEEDERVCNCNPNEFRCQAGGCINERFVCDGFVHCPDMSDEWNCINLGNATSNNQTDFLLKIKDSKVCADGWKRQNSEQICRKLGYPGSRSWTVLNTDPNEGNVEVLKVREKSSGDILRSFDSASECEDGVISLSCLPYGKIRIWSLKWERNKSYFVFRLLNESGIIFKYCLSG